MLCSLRIMCSLGSLIATDAYMIFVSPGCLNLLGGAAVAAAGGEMEDKFHDKLNEIQNDFSCLEAGIHS